MEHKTICAVSAIGAITIIELFALYCGIDGALLTGVVGVIAGLGGFIVGAKKTTN